MHIKHYSSVGLVLQVFHTFSLVYLLFSSDKKNIILEIQKLALALFTDFWTALLVLVPWTCLLESVINTG